MKVLKFFKSKSLLFALILISGMGYFINGCTHEDDLLMVSTPKIERGNLVLKFPSDPSVAFDKTHGNVGWETPYLGGLSVLTGRFNKFGFTSFNFDESNPANTSFEAWVQVNSVNTSEPGRDGGCLQTTFGTTTTMTTETANMAIIKSKSVELSPSDKGYIVKFDLTFHGATKELTGKLTFSGEVSTGSDATAQDNYGFNFEFQFLAKTDFGIASNDIADNITVKCNAIFRQKK
ncbi:MAG: YceI family protein [Chitinophagaceae bacterium]|nr:YceI family protein [Chitinophagaceae bacterium]